MRTVRKVVLIVLAVAVWAVGQAAMVRASEAPLRYDERGGDGPTLIVRGDGCLQAEDSLELRIVSYIANRDPSLDKIVYRCIVP